jgi:hypothetical protein
MNTASADGILVQYFLCAFFVPELIVGPEMCILVRHIRVCPRLHAVTVEPCNWRTFFKNKLSWGRGKAIGSQAGYRVLFNQAVQYPSTVRTVAWVRWHCRVDYYVHMPHTAIISCTPQIYSNHVVGNTGTAGNDAGHQCTI